MHTDRGRITFNGITLRECIARAYRIRDYQLNAPEWVNQSRFDIVATIPAGHTDDEFPEMLQRLLTERFKLQVHRETKELQVYGLTVAKNGPKFQESAESNSGASIRASGGRLIAKRIKMAGLASQLSDWAGRPVLDMTGLNARYDVTLEFVLDQSLTGKGSIAEKEASAQTSEPEGPSIFTAVQAQLGLKLEPRKAPVEMLIVDRVEKSPIEN